MESNTLNGKAFYGKVFRIALPIALQALLTRLVDASDTLMLGALSQDALSAISLATSAQFVLNMISMSINSVISAMAAQYWGKKDVPSVEKTLGFALKVSLSAAFVFFAASVFAPRFVMKCFTDDETLISLGISYLRIAGISYLFMGMTQPQLTIMKNTGRVAKSSVFASSAVVLNLIFNAVLIFGLFGLPAMGIQGAALATVLSRGIELTLCLIESARVKEGKLRLRYILRDDKPIRRQYLSLLPAILLNQIVWSLGQTVFTSIIGHLGNDAVAANSLANIARQLAFCFCNGVGAGSGVIIGNELGADHLETAKIYAKRLLWLAFATGVVSGLIMASFVPLIVPLAKTLTPTASRYLRVMLYIGCIYVAGRSPNTVFVHGIFYAGGDMRFGLICDAINLWCVIIPIGALLAFVVKAPVLVVYCVLCMDELIKVPVEIIHYRKYKWLRNITKQA